MKIKVIPSEDDSSHESMKIFAKYNGTIITSQIIAEISALKDVYEVEI